MYTSMLTVSFVCIPASINLQNETAPAKHKYAFTSCPFLKWDKYYLSVVCCILGQVALLHTGGSGKLLGLFKGNQTVALFLFGSE